MDADLRSILGNNEMPVERRADMLIAHSRTEEIPLNIIAELSRHETPYLRSAAAICISKKGIRELHEIRMRLLGDGDKGVVQSAISSMGSSGDSRSLFCLVNYYKDAPVNVKENILSALSKLEDPRSIMFLFIITQTEEKRSLRGAATDVLYDMIPPRARFPYSFSGPEDTLQRALQREGTQIQ